ncbi:MAG: hypothetical protein AAF846_09690 [Chloroflexota bacterium]
MKQLQQDCWQINAHGFLMTPEPLLSLSGYLPDGIAEQLDHLSVTLPDLLESKQVIETVKKLPLVNVTQLTDSMAVERTFQIYGYLATAHILEDSKETGQVIPENIAVPLCNLAEMVQRPPILSYAPFTLSNWRMIDSEGEFVVDNLELVHQFLYLKDASWFTLIHVDIEARAGQAVQAIPIILEATEQDDDAVLMTQLENIHAGLDAMMRTLKRMPEHCHPKVYYHEVRRVMFGFNEVIYENAPQYGGKPQSFLGETGAQSSIIPSLVRLMGITHEESSMTRYLMVMRDYMPQPHRQFIESINPTQVREYILKKRSAPLNEAYNHTLHQLLTFRKMHIRYAASYIANQSSDSLGTGGTEFMTWLQQLIDETEAQLLA